MSRWFRFYDSAVEDPKVQRLPAVLFRFWVNVLCLASRNDGDLPTLADMTFTLRLPEKTILANLALLVGAGLVDELDGVSTPHNWNARQFKSDVSNERVKRHRERNKTVTGNAAVTLHVTPPESETDTEQKTEQKQQEAVPAPVLPKKPAVPAFELPPDIPAEPFKDFVEMRVKVRKPMTDKAKANLVGKLRRLAAAGEDIAAVLDQSVTASWTDVYAVKPEGNRTNGHKPASTSFGSSIGRVVESRAERGFAFQDGGGDHHATDALEDEGGPGDGNPQLRLTAQA